MSAKRALVVDDSRSARAFLTRILERYDLQVDGAASAEEAIEYLNQQRPDVIFMDHLMPGMDGFQALSVIKNDPRTATIPVMMYTSQEGELYLSQARALGAIGVLPKQIRSVDVSRALEQLHLLGERRPESEIATVRVPSLGASDVAAAAAARDHGATDEMQRPVPDLEVRAMVETMLREHSLELRRFMTQSLDRQAERILDDVRALLADAPQNGVTTVAPVAPARPWGPVLWLSAAAAVIAVVAGALWVRTLSDQEQIGAGLSSLRAQLAGGAAPPRAGGAVNAGAPGAAAAAASAVRASNLYVDIVPFGESPLAGARTEHVQAVLERLLAGGFRGTVEIRSYSGRYCLQGAGDAIALAAAETPYARCDQIGNPQDGAGTAARESVAFANMLAAVRSHSAGALELQLASGGADDVATPYPAPGETLTAGEWNRAAMANNRIEVRWRGQP